MTVEPLVAVPHSDPCPSCLGRWVPLAPGSTAQRRDHQPGCPSHALALLAAR